MLQAGANITQKDDQLKQISVDYLVKSIRDPNQEVSSLISQLRIVRTLDKKQYAQVKKRLPYFVCGIFNPPYRRTENFAFIQHFVVDVDKLSEKQLSIQSVREMVQKDNRVEMCFVSPSDDGIKIMYKLEEKCYDSGYYSLFYKAFLKKLSSEYNIPQAIDMRTSDVCRACFISEDKDVYYNSNADAIRMDVYIDEDNPFEMFQLQSELNSEVKEKIESIADDENKDNFPDPDADVIGRIKTILNPSLKKRILSPPVVPEQLEEVIDDLKKYIEETGVVITEIKSIHYGKKIRLKTNVRQAEVNLFYGKRGFSVVVSPKSGTSEELNKLMAELIQNYIYEHFLI